MDAESVDQPHSSGEGRGSASLPLFSARPLTPRQKDVKAVRAGHVRLNAYAAPELRGAILTSCSSLGQLRSNKDGHEPASRLRSEEKEPLNRNPMTEIAIDSREQAAARASYFAATLVCLVALLAPALWNGYPLLQYDTGGYLARWYEGYLVPSRSTVFGVYLHVGEGMHFWPQLVLQSACTLWIIGLVLRVTGLGSRPRIFLLVVSMLALTTSLPFLNSLLLTDIFSGV